MMMKRIAVTLDRVDQAASNGLCLKDMVQPGMVVDLFFPSRAQRSTWAIAWLTAAATHQACAVQACERQWTCEIANELESAERALAPLRNALAAAGAELRLHLYTGALRKALADLRENHDEPFAVMHLRGDRGLRKVVRLARKAVGLLPKPPVEADLAYRR